MRVSGLGLMFSPPVAGDISSAFGPRSAPAEGASTNHKGVDYPVAIGTPVSVSADGTVTFAGVQSGFGNTVVIDHGEGMTTLYGHLSQILVSVGQQVTAGWVIGLSGATGTVSGPNLHFQVMVNGSPVDPMQVLGYGGITPVSSPGPTQTGPVILSDGSVFSGGSGNVLAIAAVALGVFLLVDVAGGR